MDIKPICAVSASDEKKIQESSDATIHIIPEPPSTAGQLHSVITAW